MLYGQSPTRQSGKPVETVARITNFHVQPHRSLLMRRELSENIEISLPVKLGLALAAGVLAWATGPFGLLNKDVVSEVPAWILPGILFGALVLVPHNLRSSRINSGRAVATLGTGVIAWAAAFAVGSFGWWVFGWAAIVMAGAISGAILGLLVPRLIQSRRYLRHFRMLSLAGLLGSIPFAIFFKTMDWRNSFFTPEWVVPSYVFWNLVIATALHRCFAGDDQEHAAGDAREVSRS